MAQFIPSQRLKNMNKRVVLGLSGGVDSSVAAYLLKEAGYDVLGIFMKNWDDENCTAGDDYNDVIKVAQKLDISYHSIEFVEEYRQNVFEGFLKEYQAGRTPNPDILCNREIKFKAFYEKAKLLGADFIATGHYSDLVEKDNRTFLAKSADTGKDQTYFLHAVKESVLKDVLFPLAKIQKSEVREIAHKLDLSNKDKKDSTGICFIGERNFKQFLSEYLPMKKGEIRNLSGDVVGEHDGIAYYTIGQRSGLGLGGPGLPWFIVDKIASSNTLIVERGECEELFANELEADELTLINNDYLDLSVPRKLNAKIRYRQPDQSCTAWLENGIVRVKFDVKQRAISPGQSVVFYQDNLCLGGAIITKACRH